MGDFERLIREAFQSKVDGQELGETLTTSTGDEMPAEGIVVTWVAVIEVARPGGEGWQWMISGDSADAGRTFQAREEGLLRYGLRVVERSYNDDLGGID